MSAAMMAAAALAAVVDVKPGDLVRTPEGEGTVTRVDMRLIYHTVARDGGLQEVLVHWDRETCEVLVRVRPAEDRQVQYATGKDVGVAIFIAILPAVLLYFVAQAFID